MYLGKREMGVGFNDLIGRPAKPIIFDGNLRYLYPCPGNDRLSAANGGIFINIAVEGLLC